MTHMIDHSNDLRGEPEHVAVIGLGLLSNGTHLMLLATSGLHEGVAPILAGDESRVVDPLPQFGQPLFLVKPA